MFGREMILPLPFGNPFNKPFGKPFGQPFKLPGIKPGLMPGMMPSLMPVAMAQPMKRGGKVKAEKIAKAIRKVYADAKKKGEFVPPAVARAIGMKKAGYARK